jgi:hypothetical protein
LKKNTPATGEFAGASQHPQQGQDHFLVLFCIDKARGHGSSATSLWQQTHAEVVEVDAGSPIAEPHSTLWPPCIRCLNHEFSIQISSQALASDLEFQRVPLAIGDGYAQNGLVACGEAVALHVHFLRVTVIVT